MSDKTETKQRPAPELAEHDGEYRAHRNGPAGMDLPVLGHVPYQSIGFLAGLGVAGVAGVIEWPVVAAVGVGYALARR